VARRGVAGGRAHGADCRVGRLDTYDWLLFLHLLGAAAVVAAIFFFGVVVLGGLRSGDRGDAVVYLGLARPGGILFDVGGMLLIVFGIWLAFEADYGITDEWVIAAIVLWVVSAYAGSRTRVRSLAARGKEVMDVPTFLRERRVPLLYAVTVAAVFAMLALMIFKPGAK
jgi:uncharacterized membrane protein